ncbi:MAG: NINE protein [Pontixanthobacter sp.]
MKGQVLAYDALKAEGIISGEDGKRYGFAGSEWNGTTVTPRSGIHVDFTTDADRANQIFPLSSGNPISDAFGEGHKSPIVAGLLAFFLGGFGIHKFYLGYNKQGTILLVGTVISWVLTVIIIGIIPLMIIGVVCLIEAIIYLTKPEAEFNRIYVEGTKEWF